MSEQNNNQQSQSRQETENSQRVTLFSLIISISIGAFTLLNSFFENTTALIGTAIFMVLFVVLVRLASTHGQLRAAGRWLSGN